MREESVLGLSAAGFHRMVYSEWGSSKAARTVVCVHGLTRNGRDFDPLAEALAGELQAGDFRVVCPDIVGRGRSDWLSNGDLYGYPQYQADMAVLIARLGVETVDWIGTSMGGLIGMFLAAQPKSPIRRLIMNDVGPFIPKGALERLAGYVGADLRFASLVQLESYLRTTYESFGTLSDAQWRHLATHSARKLDDGTYALAYDPAIGRPFQEQPIDDVDLWPIWSLVKCPVLVLRGERSDLLTAEAANRMVAETGGQVRLVEIAGAGHAPALMDAAQIDIVRSFLIEG